MPKPYSPLEERSVRVPKETRARGMRSSWGSGPSVCSVRNVVGAQEMACTEAWADLVFALVFAKVITELPSWWLYA